MYQTKGEMSTFQAEFPPLGAFLRFIEISCTKPLPVPDFAAFGADFSPWGSQATTLRGGGQWKRENMSPS
jgi:hypothetical protein